MTDDDRALVIEGGGFVLRAVRADDVPALLRILTDPTVARWWGRYDEERVRAEYIDDDDEDGIAFLIERESGPAGMIQFGEENDPNYRHASVDIALAGGQQARGLGPAAIRALARYLFDLRGHHRITIDPAAANVNAIKAYERVGFRPVGVMRQYERGPDGTWHDGLLMDLLRDEFEAAGDIGSDAASRGP